MESQIREPTNEPWGDLMGRLLESSKRLLQSLEVRSDEIKRGPDSVVRPLPIAADVAAR
jgi:hypothetical protein